MTKTCLLSMITISSSLALGPARAALAGPAAGAPPAAAAAAAAQDDADDAALQPAEPEFRLINLPTTMLLPRFKSNFDLTHRFGGNLRRGSFGDQASRMFGLDDGASVGFEYRMGVARHVEAIFYRSAIARTIQLSGKIDALRQRGAVPVSASIVISEEGTDNFQEQYAPAIGFTVARRIRDAVALYAVPTWVHNSAAATGVVRNTAFVGVGARLRFRPTVYLAAEVSPRISGYRPGTPEFGVAIEKRAGGHMFQLNFTNTSGTTLAQTARGGQPRSLALGFNLSRKFF